MQITKLDMDRAVTRWNDEIARSGVSRWMFPAGVRDALLNVQEGAVLPALPVTGADVAAAIRTLLNDETRLFPDELDTVIAAYHAKAEAHSLATSDYLRVCRQLEVHGETHDAELEQLQALVTERDGSNFQSQSRVFELRARVAELEAGRDEARGGGERKMKSWRYRNAALNLETRESYAALHDEDVLVAFETVARYARENLTGGPLYAAADVLCVEVERLQARVAELEAGRDEAGPEVTP